jgi:hypothetical protein
VSEALAYHLSVFPNTTTTVIGLQIPEHWLPLIPNVRFDRLSEDAARAHFQQCGKLLFVNSFTLLTNDLATIAIWEGNQCQGGGLDVRFIRSADGWRREQTECQEASGAEPATALANSIRWLYANGIIASK